MKPLGYEPIHESNLTKNSAYLLKVRTWGEGVVRIQKVSTRGIEVEVIEGGFNTPAKKGITKGKTFTVPLEAGSWYEQI